MRDISAQTGIAPLLARYRAMGGALDYVCLEVVAEVTAAQLHHQAALCGIASIDKRLAQWATSRATPELPVDRFFRVRWDEAKLGGRPVSLSTFWGTDDVEPKPLGAGAWSTPEVDGYKTAFFHPPYGLHAPANERTELFAGINRYLLGPDPERAEIFSWSTDWSNYFDAGHEWWGAFYWTVRPCRAAYIVIVGASSTD